MKNYKHLLLQIYWLLYLPWFAYLEKTVTTRFHIVHVTLDDYIPFCEYFIIPYLLWFGYIGIAIIYFAIKNKQDYYNLCKTLFFGMTVFLIISTSYPNGHYLRPTTFARDNVFVTIVRSLYATDTATNLFPSIHVYNSIAVNYAIWHSESFEGKKFLRFASGILCFSIVLSTMFLKQHSVFDVVTGLAFASLTIAYVYYLQPERRQRTVLINQRLRHS